MFTSPRPVPVRLLLGTLLVAPLAMVELACASARDPSSADDHNQCNYINYKHDEATNAAGAGKCASDCDCDGMRSCASGACQGVARPQLSCNSPDRHWNEAWNPQGPGRCATDCECDGQRTCSAGVCAGVARPARVAAEPARAPGGGRGP